MRSAFASILSAGLLFAHPDARELVRQSIRNGEEAWRETAGYSCIKRVVEQEGAGSRTGSVDLYDIIPLGYGAAFEEHVQHNGEPLSPEERLRIGKELEKKRAEPPALKQRHFEKEAAERSYMREVPDAFDFKITGEESLPTGPAWVLKAIPRPGYTPRSRYAHAFAKMRGTLWIDKKDMQWVKADAEAAEGVTFGLFLAHLARGSRITLEQRKLPDGTWVPSRITVRAEARTFLVFNHNLDQDITYTNYRKAESLAAGGAAPPR
ncbi:MAG: hypothetical protein C5B51_30060 [Terriglobia bacterium]|nr:MAG: hypothetical protein C5B51_30060 [Terriglobia bacterium]